MQFNSNQKVDFFIVGAAKSGTSAMQDYLRQHTGVFMPELKEIHHFSPDILKENDALLDAGRYFDLFKNAGPKQLVGEASAFYLISETAAQNIKNYNPAARIIVMLRHPVEMMYSLHSQLLFNGEETITDFEEALVAEPQRQVGQNLPKHTRIVKKHFYREVVRYSNQVKRFLDAFGKEQVNVILFDDFKDNPLAAYRDVLQFLNVDASFEPQIAVVNANKKVRSAKAQAFIRSATNLPVLKPLSRVLLPGKKARRKAREFLQKINSSKQKRQPLSPQLREQLCLDFQEEINHLEKIIERDLSAWRY